MTKKVIHPKAPVNIKPIKEVSANQLRQLSWHPNTRGCPNMILRSSLFGVVAKGGHGKKNKKEPVRLEIDSPEGIPIIFTGYPLDQNDLDLWLEIVHQARMNKTNVVSFSARSMLKTLGYTIGGSNKNHLTEMIVRLSIAHLEIKTKEAILLDGLISRGRIENSEKIVITLSSEVVDLFAGRAWTQINLENRKLLKSQLARWLHGFYLSHKDPHPMYLSTIRFRCGSTAEPVRFKQMLIDAFKELEVLKWKMELKPGLTGEEKISVSYPRFEKPKAKEEKVEEPAKVLPTTTNTFNQDPFSSQQQPVKYNPKTGLPIYVEAPEQTRTPEEIKAAQEAYDSWYKNLTSKERADVRKAGAQRAKVAM